MKKLLLTLAVLLTSVGAFANQNINNPPANAFRGVAYGYEIALFQKTFLEGEIGIRVVYKNGDNWIYLAHYHEFEEALETPEAVDQWVASVLSNANNAIESELGNSGEEPFAGKERVVWLLQNKVIAQNNQLSLVR